jgi:hypothetical protein
VGLKPNYDTRPGFVQWGGVIIALLTLFNTVVMHAYDSTLATLRYEIERGQHPCSEKK